jgi:hypothetical protein
MLIQQFYLFYLSYSEFAWILPHESLYLHEVNAILLMIELFCQSTLLSRKAHLSTLYCRASMRTRSPFIQTIGLEREGEVL